MDIPEIDPLKDNKMDYKPIPLFLAFSWDCPKCKAHNFNDGMAMEVTPEDQEDNPLLEGTKTGDWIARPDEVTCSKCGGTFETEEPDCFVMEDDRFTTEVDDEEHSEGAD